MDDFDRLIEIQRMTASSLRLENEVDNKIKLLDIISNLTAGKGGGRIPMEAVIIEADMEGVSESQVNSTISALKRDRLVSEPEPGFIRLI